VSSKLRMMISIERTRGVACCLCGRNMNMEKKLENLGVVRITSTELVTGISSATTIHVRRGRYMHVHVIRSCCCLVYGLLLLLFFCTVVVVHVKHCGAAWANWARPPLGQARPSWSIRRGPNGLDSSKKPRIAPTRQSRYGGPLSGS
jgi:hypothetical protein